MTSDPVVSPVVAAGRVRVSLIGAGAWARTAHLAALAKRDDVTFVGVYDPDPQRADETAREFGFANVASSVEELLAAPSDACIIASPAARHAEQAIASLEAGRHVLLEKPMSNSAVDSWRIADLAHSTELTVMLALGWNHSPVFAEARRMLAATPLGRLEHALLHMASGTHSLLAGDSDNSSGRDDRPALSGTWTDPSLSGGGYGNAQLSHGLGVLFGLVDEGASDLSAVVRPGPVAGIELGLAVVGRLDSGATLSVSGTSIRQPLKQQLLVRLFGSEGQLEVDFLRDTITAIDTEGVETVTNLPGLGAYPGMAPAGDFVDLLTGTTTINTSDAVVGARTTEVLDVVRGVA